MNRLRKVFFIFTFALILLVSWIIVIGAQSPAERQAELIEQALIYLYDEVYILAVPLLEEAANINTDRTPEVEEMLKEAYLQLSGQAGFRRRHEELLERQMNRRNAPAEVFYEAASFQLQRSRYAEAFAILIEGIERTGSEKLIELYESNRYAYRLGFHTFDDVTAMHGTTIGVSRDGLWGVATASGSVFIPIMYEQVSTFSIDRAVVKTGGEIFAVDGNNNRVALLREDVRSFGNLSNEIILLQTDEGWIRATSTFDLGEIIFEDIGTYAWGYTAAKQNGRWGVIDRGSTWLVPAEYDEIIMDELGRSYGQGAVFARRGTSVYLIMDGEYAGGPFEDARPFGGENYAAVKIDGRWGFVNTAGEIVIEPRFDDALSFGQHLAAVRYGEYWGYISLSGEIVIEPIYLQAKSFANGSAPVLTGRGWQFITLIEFQGGPAL